MIVNTDAPTKDGIGVDAAATSVQDQEKLDGEKVKSLLYAIAIGTRPLNIPLIKGTFERTASVQHYYYY